MLIYDQITIGNKLLDVRKKSGLTQAEVAERADISDRAYADIERGCTNMRVDTLQKICNALHITPDYTLTDNSNTESDMSLLLEHFNQSSPHIQSTAVSLLIIYLYPIFLFEICAYL